MGLVTTPVPGTCRPAGDSPLMFNYSASCPTVSSTGAERYEDSKLPLLTELVLTLLGRLLQCSSTGDSPLMFNVRAPPLATHPLGTPP
jgi:hypothetical protein